MQKTGGIEKTCVKRISFDFEGNHKKQHCVCITPQLSLIAGISTTYPFLAFSFIPTFTKQGNRGGRREILERAEGSEKRSKLTKFCTFWPFCR